MQAWRLSKARYAGDLSGLGAVVMGLTPEITVLELLVHLNGVISAPLVLCTYAVPEDPGLIARPELSAMPARRDAIPHTPGLIQSVSQAPWSGLSP